MRKYFMIVLALGVLPMVACSPLENQARDVAAALSGSIVAAQSKYQESCGANPSQAICQAINRGVSGENALLTAVETYCGWAVTPPPLMRLRSTQTRVWVGVAPNSLRNSIAVQCVAAR